MDIFFIIIGIIFFSFGFSVLFGFIKKDISKDNDISKKLFSERERYFMGRYSPGIWFGVVGIMFVILGVVIYFHK